MEILHTYWLRLGRFRTVKRKQRRAKIKGDKHHCQWQGLPTTARKLGGDQLYDQAGFQSWWNQEAGRTAVVEERLSRARRILGLQSTQYSLAVLSDHKVTIITKRFGTPCFEHLLTWLPSTSTTTSSSPCFMLLMDYIYATSQCVFQLRSRTVVSGLCNLSIVDSDAVYKIIQNSLPC